VESLFYWKNEHLNRPELENIYRPLFTDDFPVSGKRLPVQYNPPEDPYIMNALTASEILRAFGDCLSFICENGKEYCYCNCFHGTLNVHLVHNMADCCISLLEKGTVKIEQVNARINEN
jgi:hypothetical protein